MFNFSAGHPRTSGDSEEIALNEEGSKLIIDINALWLILNQTNNNLGT